MVPGSVVSPDAGLVEGLGLGEFLVLPSLAPEALSVLTSLMSAVTDCIVGESGPNSSITPALANAAPVNPAAASGLAELHQVLVPTALCLATILLCRLV